MEKRCVCQNFILKQDTYQKLNYLALEKGYKDKAVFVTQKIILAYSRRIDRSRFEAGRLAKEPIPRKARRYLKEQDVRVHTMLTPSEKQALNDLVKYHNFIDKFGRPEYSMFLACAIEKMWGDRDESDLKEKEKKNKNPFDISILESNDDQDWSGEGL